MGGLTVLGYALVASGYDADPGPPREVLTVRFDYPRQPSDRLLVQPARRALLEGIRAAGRASGFVRLQELSYLGGGRFRARVALRCPKSLAKSRRGRGYLRLRAGPPPPPSGRASAAFSLTGRRNHAIGNLIGSPNRGAYRNPHTGFQGPRSCRRLRTVAGWPGNGSASRVWKGGPASHAISAAAFFPSILSQNQSGNAPYR